MAAEIIFYNYFIDIIYNIILIFKEQNKDYYFINYNVLYIYILFYVD